jgi:quercetin dioxygenase-like cupin family protein
MTTVGKPMPLPTGDVIAFLETSASTGGARVRTRALLKPEGLRAEPHAHSEQDETYEVISGKLIYRLDGKEHVAEPDPLSFCPAINAAAAPPPPPFL